MTDSTGIEFSTTVIAYPEPQYELKRDNGTLDDQMMHSLTANAVNSFTIHFIQTVVNKSDFGLYRLKVGNLYGEIIVFVNVLPRSKYLKSKGLFKYLIIGTHSHAQLTFYSVFPFKY